MYDIFCCGCSGPQALVKDENFGPAKPTVLQTPSRDPELEGRSSRIVAVSLNEGELPVRGARLRACLDAAFANLSAEDVDCVVVTRQEAKDDNNSVYTAELKALGFSSVGQCFHGGLTQVSVWAKHQDVKEICSFGVPYTRSKASAAKGVGCLAVRYHDLTLVFGSVHLDGNLVEEFRLEPFEAAVVQALTRCNGEVDAVILVGDINYTMHPTEEALQSECPEVQQIAAKLHELLKEAGKRPKEKDVIPIPEDLQSKLRRAIGDPVQRGPLAAMDGCPKDVPMGPDSTMSSLSLVPLASSTFPTYRWCTADEAAKNDLAQAGARTREDGVWQLASTTTLEPYLVNSLYFGGEKGHAGAIKKRGAMCRLGMGWLDRMYISTRKEEVVRISAVQGTPLFLHSATDAALDHLFMSWSLAVVSKPKS